MLETQQYCLRPSYDLSIENNSFSYKDFESPRFVISAPAEGRQMIAFVMTLVSATRHSSDAERLIWYGRSDVGVMDSAYLGRKTIEGLRRANGDQRTLVEALLNGLTRPARQNAKYFYCKPLCTVSLVSAC